MNCDLEKLPRTDLFFLLVLSQVVLACTHGDRSESSIDPTGELSTGGRGGEDIALAVGGIPGSGGTMADGGSSLVGGTGGSSIGANGGRAMGGSAASGGRTMSASGGTGASSDGSGGLVEGVGGEGQEQEPVLIEDVAYVFSSFTGNGEDGLHLIASYDAFHWLEVSGYKSVYQQGSELMRDPSVVYGSDGLFHMVWTTGWEEQNIAVAHSADLLTWKEEILYVWADYAGPGSEESDGTTWPGDALTNSVAENEYVHNSWAPEIFYDGGTQEYVIYWSSTIKSADVFPETWDARGDHLNHRIYFVTTRDFKTYSRRRLFYQPADRLIIDAFVCKLGEDDYRMVIKDEADSGYGNLHISSSGGALESWAEMPKDYWSALSPSPFAGGGIAPDFSRAEGPGGILVDDEWYIYADYWTDGRTRAWRANDFVDIEVEDAIEFPFHLRHGTIFQAPRSVVDALLALQ